LFVGYRIVRRRGALVANDDSSVDTVTDEEERPK